LKLPAFWSAIFFITGILAGRYLHLSDLLLFVLAAVFFAAGLIIYLTARYSFAWIAVASALFMAGIFRIGLASGDLPSNHISYFNDLGEKVILTGRIAGEPDRRPDKTYLVVNSDSLFYGELRVNVSGPVMVRLGYHSDYFDISDRIVLRGYLSTPIGSRNPGTFSYREYLLTRGISSFVSIKNRGGIERLSPGRKSLWLAGLIIPLRNYMLHVFDHYLPEPQNSLIAGFLIGETRFIPEKIYGDFKDTGTLHLLAVSGSNVALVIGTFAFMMLVFRIPLRARYLISLLIILIFCNLSYNQPSVIRASVMIGLFIMGRLAYRRVNYINIIAMAAILILIFDPLMLWDIGFQLSFAAAFGLIYFLPMIFGRLSLGKGILRKTGNLFLMTFLSTIVAQLSVAPILAANFNSIPMVGFAANLIVVPLASLAVIMSLILCLLGWIAPVASTVGLAANWLLLATLHTVDFFGSMNLFELKLSSPSWYLIAAYYITVVLGFQSYVKRARLKYFAISLLVLLNLMAWEYEIGLSDKTTEIICMDAGRQTAVSIRTASDENMLIADLKGSGCSELTQWVLAPVLIESGASSIERLVAKDQADHRKLIDCLTDAGLEVADNNRIDRDSKPIQSFSLKENGSLTTILFDANSVYDLKKPEKTKKIDLLILPEPNAFDDGFIRQIVLLKPRKLVFSSYSHLYATPAGYYKFQSVMKDLGIALFNTRFQGAIEIRSSEGRVKLKPTLKDD